MIKCEKHGFIHGSHCLQCVNADVINAKNIIRFEKPDPVDTGRVLTLSYDPGSVDVSQADSLVSYDIDAMSIHELRHSYRCMVILMHRDSIRHLHELGDLKRKYEAEIERIGGGRTL